MKRIRPNYYKDFACIGSKCKDNCCVGWEIEIDPDTAAFYQTQTGSFGKRLQEGMTCEEEGYGFRLHQNGRCVFLNRQNLCDIILTLGEENLCDICREHPRFYEWYDTITEEGIGLCCEEGARLILMGDGLVSFEEIEEGETCGEEDNVTKLFFAAREQAIRLAQEGDADLPQRLESLLYYTEALQEALDKEDYVGFGEEIEACGKGKFERVLKTEKNQENGTYTMAKILEFLQQLEPMDVHWQETLKELEKQHPKKVEFQGESTFYKRLLVYWIWRYWTKARFDGWLMGRMCLGVTAVVVTRLLFCHGKYSELESARRFSKEIEYAQENRVAVEDAAGDICSVGAFLSILP